jgi:transposase
MPFVRAYPRDSQEMVFEAHARAFEFYRGGCTRGIYDNMKTAVETVFCRQGPPVQPPFPADVRALSGRANRPNAGLRVGEGAGHPTLPTK